MRIIKRFIGIGVVTALAIGLVGCGGGGNSSTKTVKVIVSDFSNERIASIDNMSGSNWMAFGAPGSGSNVFNHPWGVATDSQGRIYISDQNNRIIRVNDMTGAGWTTFGTTGSGVNQFGGAGVLCIDAQDRIYISDQANGRIVRIDDMTGAGWTSFSIGSGWVINDIAIDSLGRIYFSRTSGGVDAKITRVNDMSGAGLVDFGTQGSGVNQFNWPSGLGFDAANRLYIADNSNNRVVRIDDMTGAGWTTYTGAFSSIEGLEVDRETGQIYLGDTDADLIIRINDMTGAGWTTQGSNGAGSNQYKAPYNLALLPN